MKREKLTNAKSQNVAIVLAVSGLIFILLANAFQYTFLKIDADSLLANFGALILFVGVIQWLFDRSMRQAFFYEVRDEIVGSHRVSESGISDFHADSKKLIFPKSSFRVSICTLE